MDPEPPAPPRPDLIGLVPPAAPIPDVLPLMDFLQRRVEALERELSLERGRAAAAKGMLSQQEALKKEVETHLKAISDQLKREKAERDGEEARSHAQGRIETLEKRLDEMTATFAQLLRDAVARRNEGPGVSAPSPGAKDAAIEALEAEKAELLKALRERQDAVARFAAERRDVEALSAERLGQIETLKARVAELERAVASRDDRLLTAGVERDELARAALAEADKLRRTLEERQRLLDIIRKKDEMIALLSASFRGAVGR